MKKTIIYFFTIISMYAHEGVGKSDLKPEAQVNMVLKMIEQKDLKMGADLLSPSIIGKLGKTGQFGTYYVDKSGDLYGVLIYTDKNRTITIYWYNHKVYGISFHGLMDKKFKEIWYFCDTSKLANHILLNMKQSE